MSAQDGVSWFKQETKFGILRKAESWLNCDKSNFLVLHNQLLFSGAQLLLKRTAAAEKITERNAEVGLLDFVGDEQLAWSSSSKSWCAPLGPAGNFSPHQKVRSL